MEQLNYLRLAAAVPRVRPGDVDFNLTEIATIIAQHARNLRAEAVVLPELALTGYTAADLFYRSDLLQRAEDALAALISIQQNDYSPLVAVGLPVRQEGRIFNAAAIFQGRQLLGVVPKTYLPNTHEFYEARWFASAGQASADEINLAGFTVPFGNNLVFDLGAGAVVGVEICEDMWAMVPPSTRLSLAGANVILNLSASNELVGKLDYRRSLVSGLSARLICAYAYAGAGTGESTTDLVFGGHALVAENGTILDEGCRFRRDPSITATDIDLDFLDFERRANFTYRQSCTLAGEVRRIPAPQQRVNRVRSGKDDFLRTVDPHPFVPSDGEKLGSRASEIMAIQCTALATRLEATGLRRVIVGLSGGLDSALALLVCVEAFKLLNLDRSGILAFTMPGFGTSDRTKKNAAMLCRGLGIPLETIDITAISRMHLSDLGHDESLRDTTYENTQARIRTMLLMNKANQLGAIAIGTGDLSEVALGWCTYNGDHMSMYSVNCGVPKTLVKYIVRWYAEQKLTQNPPTAGGDPDAAAAALLDILATPISPELLPASASGDIAQFTEEKVGPYDLHDFFLYHYIRRGAPKEKILFLAKIAFDETYSEATIKKWLDIFIHRFYSQQFKRSAMPDGPKVGTICLSPRGDWRMPSDLRAP